LVLGGVPVEHDRGPVAHSDGDVLLHALTDALLGSIGGPDIGELFPDSAAEHAGEDSARYVREAVARVRAAGHAVMNVDAVVVLERPKLGALKQRVRESVARLVGVEVSRVSVKGKTHEGVDAVGEGRAIAAQVVVLLGRRQGAGGDGQ
jgi:2-C-methyl-D-erythritol 2,4-cyclodiphosphate synthase